MKWFNTLLRACALRILRLCGLKHVLVLGLVVAVLAWCPAQAANISYLSSSTSAGSGAVNSITLNQPSGLAVDDVMLAFISQRSNDLPLDENMRSTPSGWTLVLSRDDGNAAGVLVYVKVATASEPANYSWTFGASGRAAGGIVALRGVDTANPVNTSGSRVNSVSASYTAPSVTTDAASTMLLAFFSANNGDGSVNTATGMAPAFSAGTLSGRSGAAVGASYAIQPAIGATGNRVSAANTSLVSIGALIALNPASATAGIDHYELSLPTSSLACLPTTVTVTACSDNSSPCTSAATTLNGQSASLATSGAALAASSVTFNSSGLASTTLAYPGAANGTTVSVTLSGEQTAAANPRKCCPNGSSCSVADSCATTFNTAGFIVSASANGAAAIIPTQTAGTASGTLYLRAVQTSTTSAACSAALTGANSVNFAYQCNNPASCSASNLMGINGGSATTIQRNNNTGVSGYTAVPMSFDANGNAPFSFTFNDVGQATLWFSKTVNSAPLGGSSNAFVTRPAGFGVSGLTQTANPFLANPAAASAAGLKFVKAGESFSASVTARTSGGAATPNYGKETSPEGVTLAQVLVLPSAGASGTLSNASLAGGSFSNGVATVTNLAWSEVGIITLTPSVADGNYLGAGNVTGTTSGNIGRFVPDHFALSASSVTHRPAAACSPASTFSYLGENFRLGFSLTAQNNTGATTQNYAGALAKLDPTSASSWNLAGIAGNTVFSTGSGRLALGSATGGWSNGVAAGVALSAAGLRVSSPDGPFAAAFGIAPADSDGVTLASYDLDTDVPPNGNDRAMIGNVALRFGRLRMLNAYGSEKLDLSVPMDAQYWSGSYYSTNSADSCTAIPMSSITMGNYQLPLSACQTQLSPAGSVTMVAGKLPGSGLLLTKPGAGNSGSVDLAINVGSVPSGNTCVGAAQSAATAANMPWFGPNLGARATFGVYKSPIIYRRENY